MKKLLLLTAFTLFTSTNVYAASDRCGEVAYYDEQNRAVMYKCDNDAQLAQNPLTISDWNRVVPDIKSCSGVSCPSDMAMTADCCCVLK